MRMTPVGKKNEAEYAHEASRFLWLVFMAIGPIVTAWAIAIRNGGYWWTPFLITAIAAIYFGLKAKLRLELLVRLSRESRNPAPNQPAQHNVGSPSSSRDSSISATPSAPAPRG